METKAIIPLMYTYLSIFFDLVINDFRSRYLSNVMGGVWAFVQPVVTILIFWFVFAVGFKTPAVGNMPFVLWLIAGVIPWFFLSESLSGGTNAIIENDYLVKKIVFRVDMLPIVKITTALMIHFIFVLLMIGIFMLYGYSPSLSWLQLLYYISASLPLLLGSVWITGSIVVFFRDMGQIVSMIIQFGFWLTPIFWSVQSIPEPYRRILELNPANYIVQGYRESLSGNGYFWEKPLEGFLYWGIALFCLWAGQHVFKRLRPHFADVL